MTSMLTIRPESVSDYPAIAAVNLRAFGHISEPLIVELHRHRVEFDPELSLVAEIDRKIVGHVLFSPRTVRLLGQDVRTVHLAPIAIDPPYQKQGIGGKLIQEALAVARAKGYALSVLLGHTTYYPRFGYKTRAYGASKIIVTSTPAKAGAIEERSVMENDLPALDALWLREEGSVDFVLRPGQQLMDWISPRPDIKATVFTRDGEVVGYTRILSGSPSAPRYFLACDAAAARAMVSHIAVKSNSPTVELPLHPASASTAALGTAECHAWDAGMAMSLEPNPFDEYYAQARLGQRTPGRVIWPVEFDLE